MPAGFVDPYRMLGWWSSTPTPIGSIRLAAVESRPGIRIRDMVASTLTVQGIEVKTPGIRVGGVEIRP